jgi:glutathione S-transferase
MSTSTSNLKPLILHAHATGPNPFKPAIVLEALSLPYTVKLWDFGPAANGVKGPAFLKITENGRVPAIEDPNTGVVAWESGAVINYLLRMYDQKNTLGPRGDTEQDRVDFDKWIFFLVSGLGPMQGQANWYRHYNATENADALKRYREQTYRCYGVLEGQLAKSGGESILKGGVSAVDAHFYPWVSTLPYAELSLDDYPNVKKWVESYKQRKEVKAAYEKVAKGEKV